MLPFIFIIPLLFGLISDSSWQTTFCDIGLVNSLNILHCDRIQDTLTFEAGTNIAITLTNATDTIKISSTGGKAPNQLYCDVGKWFNAFNGTTSNFRCETVPSGGSGQNNTASSSGVGYSLILPKVGVNLPFKGLWVSGDLTISQNATDITFGHTSQSFTDTNTAQIVSAGGTTLFKQRNNATQNTIKGLTTTSGITLTTNTNDVNISTNFKIDNLSLLANDYFVSSFTNSTGDWTTKQFSVNTQTENKDYQITAIDNATGFITRNQFSVNTQTCTGTDKISAIDNATGNVICSVVTSGSGITSINSAPATTAKILQSNSTSKATLKTLTQGTGITLTNGSSAVTIAIDHKVNTKSGITGNFFTSFNNSTGLFGTQIFKHNTQTALNGRFITGIDNQTGTVTTQSFKSLTTTCSAGSFVSSYNNSTGVHTCTTPSGVTSLGANVTASVGSTTDTLIWTIGLTANSGNTINGVVTVSSSVTGTAVQLGANVTNLNTRGWCHYITPLTATSDSINNFVLNTVLTGRATNTADVTGLAENNVPYPIFFTCSTTSGATAGNLKIYMTPEVAGATINAKAGSYFIKTP